jgi:hypothetical protein
MQAFFFALNQKGHTMPRPLNFPKVVGVRLTEADGLKLQHLCAHAQRPPSDLVRLLIRLACPVDVAPIAFAASAQDAVCPGPDGASLVK